MNDTAAFNFAYVRTVPENKRDMAVANWLCDELEAKGTRARVRNKGRLGKYIVVEYEADGTTGTMLVGYGNETGKDLSIICVQQTVGLWSKLWGGEEVVQPKMIELVGAILNGNADVANLQWIDLLRNPGALR